MREPDIKDAEIFLKNQTKLLLEPVAATAEEALDFLTDCMAVVLDDRNELMHYMEDEGIDIEEGEDITEELEVFSLPGGAYLYVEA